MFQHTTHEFKLNELRILNLKRAMQHSLHKIHNVAKKDGDRPDGDGYGPGGRTERGGGVHPAETKKTRQKYSCATRESRWRRG